MVPGLAQVNVPLVLPTRRVEIQRNNWVQVPKMVAAVIMVAALIAAAVVESLTQGSHLTALKTVTSLKAKIKIGPND